MSVDPRAVQELFKDIKHATRRKYLSHWEEFLQFSGITVDNPPTAEHFMEYFVNKRENANFSGSTLFTLYSSLNSVYTALYGEKLQKWPHLSRYLKNCASGESQKKAAVFTNEQIYDFLTNADNEDCWILVRKVVLILIFCGGLRMDDVRRLTFDDIVQTDDGYMISMSDSRSFTIPRLPEDELGVCFAKIVDKYFETLARDVPERTSNFLLCTGQKTTKTGTSRLLEKPVGINTLGDTGRCVAKWLNLPYPERFTGNCFRRTAAVLAAQNRTSCQTMQKHFGWKNAKTALQYLKRNRIPTTGDEADEPRIKMEVKEEAFDEDENDDDNDSSDSRVFGDPLDFGDDDDITEFINSSSGMSRTSAKRKSRSSNGAMPNHPDPISSHVLDTSRGCPASGIKISLSKQEKTTEKWILMCKKTTNEDGRASAFLSWEEFQPGIYKMHFEIKDYFRSQNVITFYPYAEVVFEITDHKSHYHVPLILSPHGYSTYRGS